MNLLTGPSHYEEPGFAAWLSFTQNTMWLHRADCSLVEKGASSTGAWDQYETLAQALEWAEQIGFAVTYCGACRPQGDIAVYIAEQLVGGRNPVDVANDLVNSGLEIEQALRLVDEVSAALVEEANTARASRDQARPNSSGCTLVLATITGGVVGGVMTVSLGLAAIL